MVEIIARWPDGGEGSAHRGWVYEATAALAPHALPGGYANLVGPDDCEQIVHAYRPDAARLHAARARYDPIGMCQAVPLPD